MPDLAGAVVGAEVQLPVEDEAAADAGAAHDADHVARPVRRAHARLGERERVAVVDERDRPAEGLLERRPNRAPGPVSVEVREQHCHTVGVEEARQRDADRADVPRRVPELDHSPQHGLRPALL